MLESLLQDRVGCRHWLAKPDDRDIHSDRRQDSGPMYRVTRCLHIPRPGQPETGAIGQLDESLKARAPGGSLSDGVSPVGPRKTGNKQFCGVGGAKIREQDHWSLDRRAASRGRYLDFLVTVFCSTQQRPGPDEETGRCDAFLERPAGSIANVDEEPACATVDERVDGVGELAGGPRGEPIHPHIPKTLIQHPRGDSRASQPLAGELYVKRLVRIASDQGERDDRPWLSSKQPLAFECREPTRGVPVDRPDEVSRDDTGLARGRFGAGGNDLQVVLTRYLDSKLTLRERLTRFNPLHVGCRQIRAVSIETAGETAQGAMHHLVDIDLLDILAADQRHHVLENSEVTVGVLARHGLAKKAPDHGEGDDRNRREKDDKTGPLAHRDHYSRCVRVLGVDVGKRRIGLALSDASATLASPLRVLTVSQARLGVVAVAGEIAVLEGQEDGLAAVVVGLPRSLSGAPHAQTRHVLDFVAELRRHTTLPVHLQDERLSSREAESRLAQREKNWRRRKARLDAAAAAIILQDFLDEASPADRDREQERG